MSKHAYLIMAHGDFTILEKLLQLIDADYNDIYLHIDAKAKDVSLDRFQKIVKKSSLFFVPRMDVRWGSYKQIACEYQLLKEASKNAYHYYHLISGVDLPLTTPDEIYTFFEQCNNQEFVCFDEHKGISEYALERLKYYHFLVPWARSSSKILRKIFGITHFYSIKLQKKLKVNRLKKTDLIFRKGANWVSITHDFVIYLLNHEKEIKKIFRYSYCADELFVQTLLYNSKFYDKVCSKKDDDYSSIKRMIDWNRGEPYTFQNADYELLMNCNCFWARKFSTKVDQQIIDRIYEKGMREYGKS